MYERITDSELEKRSLTKVSTTPTEKTAFGESGLSAKELKARFDLMPKYIALRLNEIFDGMKDGTFIDNTSSPGESSLGYIVRGIRNGNLAKQLAVSTPTKQMTLEEAVTKLVELIDEFENGEIFKDFVQNMTSLDDKDGNLLVEDYKDGKTFPDTYNRVYVERSNGRGLYSRYCLTAVEAPRDPDRADYEDGKTLDSVPMRMSNGYLMSPIIRADDAEALAKLAELGYNTDYYLMPKSYVDSLVAQLFTIGENGGLKHGNNVENTGKCNLSVGVNAKASAAQASAIGDGVEAGAWGAFAINRNNKAKHSHSFVGGIGNFSTRDGQTTLGRYAAGDANYNLLVGVGDDESNRKNGFGVMYDGRVLIGKDPTAPMHAVPLHLLEERIAGLVGSAPETLDALNELAAALGNDPNFATTVANQIGAKVSKTELQETESAILEGLGAILAAQEEILGGGV